NMQEQQMAHSAQGFPLVMTMRSEALTERLKAMPIEEIQTNFFALMDGIVTAYGDKKASQAVTMQPLSEDIPEDAELLYEVDENGNVLPVIPYGDGDEFVHTDEHPNCDDPTCPCNQGE